MSQLSLITASLLLTTSGIIIIWVKKDWFQIQKEKRKKSSEEKELLESTYRKLITLFESNEYYLKKNIKVVDLAELIGSKEKIVSKSINVIGETNFNDFINSYRIEYAKALLIGIKFQHFTIEALAEESGFSNKVSFYNAFKKKVGQSPSEFRARKHS